ncbi:hypothetical protein RFI_24245 [Reticulomyxa filosa]|uniref:Uncharacterized protein n=1 Tax=Reticulomyxa filosa TaxID=46433 RepID=X6MGV7_RETFI|nr:hypothetical protein RFI_24245 [Reticulomyxa filosa]|eukprot:ETO13129.1 hypothetical protein RFI_24245 [Reticulomyxa filosa]
MTNGMESTEDYYYRKSSCTNDIDPSISNFCSDMEYVGKVWLACGILSIIWAALAIGVAIKWKKESKALGALLLLCWVNLSIGVGTWNNGERCTDIESWTSEIATFDTHIGVFVTFLFFFFFCSFFFSKSSLGLLYTAIAHAVAGFVLWCYFMANIFIKSRAQQQLNGNGTAPPQARVTIGDESVNE